jgi:anti-sigma factor RsiW
MTSSVTPQRAREIIAAHGAEPRRWPAGERDGVLARIADDPALARPFADARELDDLLDAAPAPPAVAINPVAIVAAATRRGGSTARPPASLRWRMAGMAAAALLGFAIGVSGLAPLHGPADLEDLATTFAALIEEDLL